MRIGPLRERITIQQKSRAADDMGGAAATWAAIATTPTVWARVERLTGKETMTQMQVQGSFTHKVWMRYRTDLDLGQRIVWGSKTLNIRATLTDEKRAYAVAFCEEGVAT